LKNLEASLPFDHICIDVKNMQLTKRGNSCYLLLIDVFTKYVFIRALKEQTAIAVARVLLQIFCTVGFPRIIGSDNGSEFVNELMTELVRISRIDHRLISAYHHRANGIAERAIRTTSDVIYKQLEGQVDQWDRYVDSTQLFCNLKEAESTGSTPYSLVFARKANAFEDYSAVEENPLNVEQMQQRLDYMNALVYPAVVQKNRAVNLKRNEYFKKRHHVIIDQFMPGAVVMVRDETRNDKVTPRYEGPFTVVRRNQGGAYVLRNALQEEFVRPPNVLKLVHHDLRIPGLPGVAAEVDKILDHKEVGEETHYLVHWRKQPSSLDEWVPHSEFNDLGPILKYHKILIDKKDIQSEVLDRKGKHRKQKEKDVVLAPAVVKSTAVVVEDDIESTPSTSTLMCLVR
jgi:transposase InsO family protein